VGAGWRASSADLGGARERAAAARGPGAQAAAPERGGPERREVALARLGQAPGDGRSWASASVRRMAAGRRWCAAQEQTRREREQVMWLGRARQQERGACAGGVEVHGSERERAGE
jgi:hypothetical protein